MNDKIAAVLPQSLPRLLGEAAFFIDFDGTLVPIAERPSEVSVARSVLSLLQDLSARSAGAVAVITGRTLESADSFLAPLKLPIAAEHGFVRRDALGGMHLVSQGKEEVAVAVARLQPLVHANPGLLLERKTSSAALHYRQRPELAVLCKRAAEESLADLSNLALLPGKMVLEIRPKGTTKGTAVAAFLKEPPFAGRLPVCAGDDLTDEDAFAVVNARDGISIKIGEGETVAKYRTGRESFIAWLEQIAAG